METIRHLLKGTILSLVSQLLSTGSSLAATITWASAPATVSGGYGQTLSTGLFDSANLLYAENTGGSAQTFGTLTHWVPAVLHNSEVSGSMGNRAEYEKCYQDFKPSKSQQEFTSSPYRA